jgi:hypothetical protein
MSMDQRTERVLIETERYRVVGTITLPRDGYRSRLSDYINSPERDFVSLTDCELRVIDQNGNAGEPVDREFVAIARSHMVLVTPLSRVGSAQE